MLLKNRQWTLLLVVLFLTTGIAMAQSPGTQGTLPDNVDTADCTSVPPAHSFNIKKKWKTFHGTTKNDPYIHGRSTPLVGDLNGDGHPEVIVPMSPYTDPTGRAGSPNVQNHNSALRPNTFITKNLAVIDGSDGSLKYIIQTCDYQVHGQPISIADIDNDGKPEIVILSIGARKSSSKQQYGGKYLYCYDATKANTGPENCKWKSKKELDYIFIPMIADINNDGYAEIVAGNCVFNFRGDLLVEGTLDDGGMGFGGPHNVHGGWQQGKGQELGEHYYGTIAEKVGAYMKDINRELWKLGGPAKTQHNEAAPCQHELAPLYEQCNIATDHNQMTMETMKRVAGRHGMVCLLHEKPFAGVNGSGKHNNWSLLTDEGRNLLKPGDKPHENLEFLLILACVIKAVDKHAELIRYSSANVGNDLRLGGNEAPPSIVSIFLGEQLQDVLDQFAEKGSATHSIRGGRLKTGVAVLPDLNKDATDRNRTSPFAFTGNKFELRTLGSSDSLAMPNIVLNTIVAEAFKEACDELGTKPGKAKISEYIAKTFSEHRRVVFNGNGYGKAWIEEAKRRKLPNLKSMVDAIPAITDEKAVELFEKFGVFTKSELDSRAEIEFEMYAKEINIEARTMLDIATKQIIPATVSYLGSLAGAKIAVNTAVPGADTSVQETLVNECSALLASTRKAMDKLSKEIDKAAGISAADKSARAYREKVVPAMEGLRKPVDALEMLVDKNCWPMPSYGDIIF